MTSRLTAGLTSGSIGSRIPTLDGLRAVSIFLVLCLHSQQRLGTAQRPSLFWSGLLNGESGVFIFFEISGFLITTLLLEEYRRRGSISLRGFYLRRAFRILPPLYVYLGAVVLLGMAGRLAFSVRSTLSALFFLHNLYAPGGMWSLEHLWSISVEEQFYLVWPVLLVGALRCSGSRAPARGGRYRVTLIMPLLIMPLLIAPLLVVVLSPVARMVLGHWRAGTPHFLATHLFRFDFIMFGCLAALLQNTPAFERFYRAATRAWWVPPGVIVGCNFLSARYQNYFDLTIGYTVSGVAIALFLLWCTRNPASAVGRVLNHPLVARIGVLSYSIYLWQTLWLHPGNATVFKGVGWLARLPESWLAILLCAVASYYLVEQPALRTRARLLAGVAAVRLRLHPELQEALGAKPL